MLVGTFPAPSETFVIDQIAGLLGLGHDVRILARKPGDMHHVHQTVRELGLLERTTYYGDIPHSRPLRLLGLARRLLAAGWQAPSFALRAVSQLARGRTGALTRMHHMLAVGPTERSGFDVVHCQFGHNGLRVIPLRAMGLLRGRLIVSFHGYDLHVVPRKLGPDVYHSLFSAADLITVNSRFSAGKLRTLGCPEGKLVLLPVGLLPAKIPFAPRTLQRDEPIRLLTVARLIEVKGVEYALRAVALLYRQHRHIEYHVVGDGPLRAPLETLARELGIAHIVRFRGWQTRENLAPIWRQSHIFVLSSVTTDDGVAEGQGLALIEAQAAGMPVVATAHNGFPDSVRAGQTGFLVPEKDSEALAAALSTLLTHPERWSSIGKKGREFVEEHFDNRRLHERLDRLYAEVVEAPRAC